MSAQVAAELRVAAAVLESGRRLTAAETTAAVVRAWAAFGRRKYSDKRFVEFLRSTAAELEATP